MATVRSIKKLLSEFVLFTRVSVCLMSITVPRNGRFVNSSHIRCLNTGTRQMTYAIVSDAAELMRSEKYACMPSTQPTVTMAMTMNNTVSCFVTVRIKAF